MLLKGFASIWQSFQGHQDFRESNRVSEDDFTSTYAEERKGRRNFVRKYLLLVAYQLSSVIRSPLNPHTLFWNDLFAKSFSKDESTVLELSVDDLIQAPRTKGTLFKVNKYYRGKKFINLDYV